MILKQHEHRRADLFNNDKPKWMPQTVMVLCFYVNKIYVLFSEYIQS